MYLKISSLFLGKVLILKFSLELKLCYYKQKGQFLLSFWVNKLKLILCRVSKFYCANNQILHLPDRSSHQRCSIKKGILRNSPKVTSKHLCQILFFNKVAGLRPATLLQKRLWRRCFPVIFVKFLRTYFLHNTSGWLLLTRHRIYLDYRF